MKGFLKKTWHFLWHEDDITTWKGILSLLINLVLAFIIIKFAFYPALGFVFQTDYPIVAVLSESMEHQQINPCLQRNIYNECVQRNKESYEICGKTNKEWSFVNYDNYWELCGKWYEDKSITKEVFSSFKLKNGFSKGDMLFIYGADPEDIGPGDIIVFEASKQYPIIHRVIRKYEENGKIYYQTKGDHNPDSITTGFDETRIPHDANTFKGKAFLWIPYLGYVKIIPTELIKLII